MDIVAYSTLQMDRQHEAIHRLQEAVRSTSAFARAVAEDQLISLPTGDGMALVFFRDPEGPIRSALEISKMLCNDPGIKLRMGIHTGPVYRVADINANRNVAGGGINIAQRVMDCGDANHILIDSTTVGILKQVGSWDEVFHDLGEIPVKHGLIVHLYNVYRNEFGNPQRPRKFTSLHQVSVGDLLLERYRLLEELGNGGVGTVYRATDIQSGDAIAIKLMHPIHAADPATVAHFEIELTVSRTILHTGIVPVYGVNRLPNGRPFVVMELVKGRNLKQLLASGKAFQSPRALNLASQIASALGAAHSAGISHNDLKLDNILVEMINAGERARIVDFGMANVRDFINRKHEAEITGYAFVLETWETVAPERLRGERCDGILADVYAVGAILYHMLTGQVLFDPNQSPSEFIIAVTREIPIPPHERRPDLNIPLPLSRIVSKALDKEAPRRYQNCNELLQHLQALPVDKN